MNAMDRRPMPMAEAAACCGQLHCSGAALEQSGTNVSVVCDNCPLLIERKRDDVLRAARAH